MMKTKLIALLFALAVAAQLWVPASMIYESEKSLKAGKAFKFRTAPVDPYDAFRGKYVALDFTESSIDSQAYRGEFHQGGKKPTRRAKVYVSIEEDSSGFAKVVGLQSARPARGHYVMARVRRVFRESINLEFPFSKFFLEECKAEKAEALYRRQNRRGKLDSYAVVRVGSNGHAVIEDLVLGGTPVMEALR